MAACALLFQRLNPYEPLPLPHMFPVFVKLRFMETRSLPNEIPSSSRINFAVEQFAVEIELCVLSLVLRVKMRRVVIPVEHANYYTKENAYGRHANRTFQRGLKRRGAGFEPAPMKLTAGFLVLSYAFPVSFKPRSTFSGLNGNLLMRTPVALKIALAMQAMGGTQAISPAPLAP
jgi:hypothetical protein